MMRHNMDGGRLPRLYQIFHGEVARLQNYGAFIKIPGCRKQGLVHKSQMSTSRVEDPSEILARGEKVFCKVIGMEGDGEKISLSMKVVSQTSGKDLDPNNIQSSQDERKRRQWNPYGNKRIELGSELNTTCRRCGGRGHMAMDCYVPRGGGHYAMIPEMDDIHDDREKSYRRDAEKEKKKKKKKQKKQKSKRRSSSSSSSSSSGGSDTDEGPKRKTSKGSSSGHVRRPEKYRQRSDSGSSSEVEVRSKRRDNWQSKGDSFEKVTESSTRAKYGARRAVADHDSGSDSEGQGYRKLGRSSQDFRQTADRGRSRSRSRERKRKVESGREKRRSREDSKETFRKRFSPSGDRERERVAERYQEVAKKRSRSDSDSEEDEVRMRKKRDKMRRDKYDSRRAAKDDYSGI